MPYIKQQRRAEIDGGGWATSPGELNYQLTRLALRYLNSAGINYQNLNDVIGAFEAAKLEFYRRAVVPYEDKKIKENGDIYGS